jgi:hypothetical protein
MRPDYLWDRSGEPDPEIERLEHLLGALRSDRPAPRFPERLAPAERSFFRPLGMAAAVALLLGGGWILSRISPLSGWEVSRLEGTPRVAEEPIGESTRLAVGQWLETDATARARVAVGKIGEMEVEPNTRMQLVRARAREHRVSIARGEIHALIWAPPRQFFVDTPAAVAVDLGCRYDLKVDDRGDEFLEVLTGWVAFERQGRESFIPAGAACHARRGAGPGTPYYLNASPGLRDALDRFDFGRGGRGALDTVLSEARKQDAVTLWHLLARAGPPDRPAVYKRMAALVPPPAGVTRQGILALDRDMLDRWWNQLGLEDAEWWRVWKGPYPGW